jgi:hypothetical protein
VPCVVGPHPNRKERSKKVVTYGYARLYSYGTPAGRSETLLDPDALRTTRRTDSPRCLGVASKSQ